MLCKLDIKAKRKANTACLLLYISSFQVNPDLLDLKVHEATKEHRDLLVPEDSPARQDNLVSRVKLDLRVPLVCLDLVEQGVSLDQQGRLGLLENEVDLVCPDLLATEASLDLPEHLVKLENRGNLDLPDQPDREEKLVLADLQVGEMPSRNVSIWLL